jgi:carbamoyl-phosphate synthase large subunit
MNVLLTTAGRRNYLVRWFQEALEGEGRVIASNSIDCPAFYAADGACVSPLIKSDEYVPFLIDLCRRERVELVVPLFDPDVVALARHQDVFEKIGAIPVVPSADVAALCIDKLWAARYLEECGIGTPRTFDVDAARDALESGELSFPVVVKVRAGMSGIDMRTVQSADEFKVLSDRLVARRTVDADIETDHIVQEYVRGQEYGLDVICDLKGAYVTTVVKRKLGMRAGETDAALTVDMPDLQELGEKLAHVLPHPGNLDVDLIMSEDGPQVLDVNPRFGGGYPFSHAAGCDLPRALVGWRKGLSVDPALLAARPGIASYKYISIVTEGKVI